MFWNSGVSGFALFSVSLEMWLSVNVFMMEILN